jgi:ABC-type Fe3+-hydroxamate transport system substrate-binding protein
MRSTRTALAALLALLVAGCGSSDGDAPPAATRSSAFPVTVTHRLGTTTVPPVYTDAALDGRAPRSIAASG